MFLMRAIKVSDTKNFIELVQMAHPGITSLPKDISKINKKIEKSVHSFLKELPLPKKEIYLFVLEDTKSKQLVGTSGIYSQTGLEVPTYYYQIEEEQHPQRKAMGFPLQKILMLGHYSGQASEICSLFLHHLHRQGGLGKLLSLSRFLFIASNRQRFNDRIIANLRGVIDQTDKSPFWEGIGRHFIKMDFETALNTVLSTPSLLPIVLPKHPIYLSLLPEDLQRAVGTPNRNSAPALKILLREGFEVSNKIDTFDGGPFLEAWIDRIGFIKESKTAVVSSIDQESEEGKKVIICNNSRDFRAVYAHINPRSEGEVSLSRAVAEALEVEQGSTVRYSYLGRGNGDA